MDSRIDDNRLAFDVTHRLVLSIALPMTLGFMTTPLLGLTNTAVVGAWAMRRRWRGWRSARCSSI